MQSEAASGIAVFFSGGGGAGGGGDCEIHRAPKSLIFRSNLFVSHKPTLYYKYAFQ